MVTGKETKETVNRRLPNSYWLWIGFAALLVFGIILKFRPTEEFRVAIDSEWAPIRAEVTELLGDLSAEKESFGEFWVIPDEKTNSISMSYPAIADVLSASNEASASLALSTFFVETKTKCLIFTFRKRGSYRYYNIYVLPDSWEYNQTDADEAIRDDPYLEQIAEGVFAESVIYPK